MPASLWSYTSASASASSVSAMADGGRRGVDWAEAPGLSISRVAWTMLEPACCICCIDGSCALIWLMSESAEKSLSLSLLGVCAAEAELELDGLLGVTATLRLPFSNASMLSGLLRN